MIYDILYDFQKNIVDRFKHRESFGLFLDMGLGKTPTSLAFAEANNCTKVIVITVNAKAMEPATIPGSWLDWASKSDIKYVFHGKSLKDDFNGNDFLLLNYESLFKRGDRARKVELKDKIYDFIDSCKGSNLAIIVDESHKMKNLQSIQTQSIMQIKRYASMRASKVYTYLLTGTPFTQGFVDLYAQLKMLGCAMTKTTFIDNFCVRGNIPGLLGWQQPIVSYKNVDELFNLVHKFALTIKSEEVVSLPDKIFKYISTDMSAQFELLVKDRIEVEKVIAEANIRNISYAPPKTTGKINNPFYKNIAYPELKWIADSVGVFWLRARELSIGFNGSATDYEWYDRSRLDKLEMFLRDHEDNYLLFYNYTPELLEIYDVCEKLGYKIDIYCGEIKSLRHYQHYCSLSEGEKLTCKKNIILANFKSGSEAMNWQEYSKGIMFSVPLYKDYEQGTKRIHRLGQKNTVVWYIFYQKNWLDNAMLKALKENIDYSTKMFESDLQKINLLTKKDE